MLRELFESLNGLGEVSRIAHFVGKSQVLSNESLSTKDNSSIPLYILLIPIGFALFNIIMAYLGGLRYRKLKKVSSEHEWLLQQKNNCLAMIRYRLAAPLKVLAKEIDDLMKSTKISDANFKKLNESLSISETRVDKLTQELKRSTLNITNESVDIIPFYRSATTIVILATTGFVVVVLNSVLATTKLISITFTMLAFQILIFVLATMVVIVTTRYKRISDQLVMHAKATIHLEQQIDLAKDHMISLVVKIISADIEDLKRTIGLFVEKADQEKLQKPLSEIDAIISRLNLLNSIDNRLIQSEVRVLNDEDFIEDVFRDFQKELSNKGVQVEHFHRAGATNIQPSVIQDYALLKIAVSEIFHNSIISSPPQSIIKVVSEHGLTSSSFSVIDQGPGFKLSTETIKPFSWDKQIGDKGVGIGLYLADQIMHILGGEMHITSKKGVGTTVKLSFTNNYIK